MSIAFYKWNDGNIRHKILAKPQENIVDKNFFEYFLKRLDKQKMICYNGKAFDGRLAQLGEHLPYKQRVTGSSPVLSTIESILYTEMAW